MQDKTPQLVIDGMVGGTAVLPHRALSPNTPGPHPTVVMIHGRAGNEDVMWVFARAMPPNWLLVAPRAIEPDPDGGYSWHPRQPGEWPALTQFDEAVSAVFQFIHTLPNLYHADLNHIYLMGFSQGTATAYATALKHPGLVKGIAGLVGFMPTHTQAQLSLHNLPVLMMAGKQDPTIPYTVSLQCAAALRSFTADLTYHEYDTGHKLNAQGMKDLKSWFEKVAR